MATAGGSPDFGGPIVQGPRGGRVRLRRHRHARRTARHAVESAVEGSAYRFPVRPDRQASAGAPSYSKRVCQERGGTAARPARASRISRGGQVLEGVPNRGCCHCREARRASHRGRARHSRRVAPSASRPTIPPVDFRFPWPVTDSRGLLRQSRDRKRRLTAHWPTTWHQRSPWVTRSIRWRHLCATASADPGALFAFAIQTRLSLLNGRRAAPDIIGARPARFEQHQHHGFQTARHRCVAGEHPEHGLRLRAEDHI